MLFPTTPKQRAFWLLLVILLIWFSNLDYRKLVKPDEGRYAEIPREMVASGDWTTPRLNGIKYFEKPPLQYWATASAYTLFGEHEWTTRLWSALTGLLGIVAIFYAGLRLFGKQAGFYAALVLGSSLLYVLIGHINTLDMGVTFFMTLALVGFLLAQRDAATPLENRVWMYITWANLALSLLSKGLIGPVLPGAVLVIYAILQRDFAIWKRLHLITGLAIMLVIGAPWFIAVSMHNPEFPYFFFVHEHFERFLTKVHGRFQPWWYFVPIYLLGVLPWLVPMVDALARAWKRDAVSRFQPRRFLLVWIVFIYLFFSVSDSKLPSYILPIFPALALLIGERLTHMSARTFLWQSVPIAIFAAVCVWLAPSLIDNASDEVPLALYISYAKWALVAAIIWLLGSLFSLFFAYRDKRTAAIIILALTGLVSGQLILSGHESLAPSNSSYHIAQQIKPYIKPDTPIYSLDTYDQTLPFYIKRTVTLVRYQDELKFGLEQEPHKWIPDLNSFKQIWDEQPYALAIMPPDTYSQMEREGLPMRIIARDTRRVIVRTP